MTIFAFSEVKIGVINSQELLQKTKKGSQTLKNLDAFKSAKEKQIQAMVTELEALDKELNSAALNASDRDKKMRIMEDKKIAYERTVRDAQNELQNQSLKVLGELEKEFVPIIQQVGQAKGYAMVLDIVNSGVTYFAPEADITADVIKAVDEKLPVK